MSHVYRELSVNNCEEYREEESIIHRDYKEKTTVSQIYREYKQ